MDKFAVRHEIAKVLFEISSRIHNGAYEDCTAEEIMCNVLQDVGIELTKMEPTGGSHDG